MTQPESIRDMERFGCDLIGLGQHIVAHPELPRPYVVGQDVVVDHRFLSLRLVSDPPNGADRLSRWASTLVDVASYAHRIADEQVDGNVEGYIEGQFLQVIATLPPELFPAGKGRHEWDFTVQLQEA